MNQEYNNMAHKPIFPLLMKMAIPPMISMLIQSMYNIIDSIFVAKLGEKALTALSLAFPLQNLSLAFSVGLGVAINALIAQNLGANNKKRADNISIFDPFFDFRFYRCFFDETILFNFY